MRLMLCLLLFATLSFEVSAEEAIIDLKYAACLRAETEKLPGEPKLAIDGANMGAFGRPDESGIARSEVVDVEGQPFGKAIRVHVLKPVQPVWQVQFVTPDTQVPIKKGDVLLVVFYARCLESKAETGVGHA